MIKVDLNSDLGEGFGDYKLGLDSEIIKYVSSVNLACGYHASDPMLMDKTVKMCQEAGVAVGAHPGNPDLMGFGRRYMKLKPIEVKNYVKYQIGALTAFTTTYGLPLQHVVPHGAMGHAVNENEELARAVCEAVKEVNPEIILMGFYGGPLVRIGKEMGLYTANEIFADRAYLDDGRLVPRGTPGAIIHDPEESIRQAVRMIKEKKVRSITGKEIDITGETICVHGDTPEAVAIVKRLREALTAEGIQIANLIEIVKGS